MLTAAESGQIESITSEAPVDELRDVLMRDKFHKYLNRLQTTSENLINQYLTYTKTIEPSPVAENTVRDRDDVIVLEAAIGGQAAYVVTGDSGLILLWR